MFIFDEHDYNAKGKPMVAPTSTLTLTHTLTLTATPLHFICEAATPLQLDGYRAGTNLRGALGNVMQRAYCAGDRNDPEHAATCPVCWLLAADERPGQERRGYTLRPPLNEVGQGRVSPGDVLPRDVLPRDVLPERLYEPGQRFGFGLTLFGPALRYLPYFILAVPEMGRLGVGTGRGKFALKQVWAADPLTGQRECLLAEGDSLVHSPQLSLNHQHVSACAARLEEQLALNPASKNATGAWLLTLKFLTPLRLIVNDELLKAPDFGVLFARLLKRLDELEEQFGSGSGSELHRAERRRPLAEVQTLQDLANQVRLMQADTQWADVWSGSSRTGNRTPIGGLVGRATYSAPTEVWRPLLPWLVWGQLTQVGKDTVKGNGVYEIQNPNFQNPKSQSPNSNSEV